jgi:Spy/CpxP family protein refolding chaperone
MGLAACMPANSAADATDDQPSSPEQSAQDALAALETTPEQVDRLMALVGKFLIVFSKSGGARRAFTDELLRSLWRGRVDRATIDPLRQRFETAIREATPEVLALVNELHGILTPAQRAQLIDGFAARSEASEAKRKASNKKIIDALDIGIMQKLDIAKAMRDRMAPMRPAFEKMRADARAAGEAFKRDDFDATGLELAKTNLGQLYLEGAVVLVEALAPQLEHEQRTKLAGIIKHRMSGGGRSDCR